MQRFEFETGATTRDDEQDLREPADGRMEAVIMARAAERVARIERVVMLLLGQLSPKLRGFSGALPRLLVKKVMARFKKDHIDEETLHYIVLKVLVEMGAIAESSVVPGELDAAKKERAERIVFDVVTLMKSDVANALLAVIGQEGPAAALATLAGNLAGAGLSSEAMSDVICKLWARVQRQV